MSQRQTVNCALLHSKENLVGELRAAARQSEAQAGARYRAGLASIVEVADAQSLLAQAEVQDQLARIDVWRALLAQSAAQGTLTPFLSLVNPSAGVR